MKNKITPCIWSLISNTHIRKAESVEILIRAILLNKEEINSNFKNKWLKIYKNKNWKPIGDLTEHLKLAAQLGVVKTDILTPGKQKINILAKLVNNGTIKISEYISIILFNLVSFINYEYRHILKMTLELLKKRNNSPVLVDEIFQNFNFGEPVCPEFDIKLLRYRLKQKDHIFYILISGVFFEVLSTRKKNKQYSTEFFRVKLYDHWYAQVDELIRRCNNQLESYSFEKASLLRLDYEKWSNYLTQNSQSNYDYIVEVNKQKEIRFQENPNFENAVKTPEQKNTNNKLEFNEESEKKEKTSKINFVSSFDNELLENCDCETYCLDQENEQGGVKKINSAKTINNLHHEQFQPNYAEIPIISEHTNLKNNKKQVINFLENCCVQNNIKNSLKSFAKFKSENNNEKFAESKNSPNNKNFFNEKFSLLPPYSHASREMKKEVSKYSISNPINSKEYYFNYFIHKVNKIFNFSLQNLLNEATFKKNFYNLLDFRKNNDQIVLKPKKTLIKNGKNLILISPSANLIYSEIKEKFLKPHVYEKNYEIVTFFDKYNPENFVGINDYSLDSAIKPNFIPSPFLTILHKAYWNPKKKYYLILENFNSERAKTTLQSFKPLFVRGENGESLLGISNFEMSNYIFSRSDEKIYIPGNLTIIGVVISDLDNNFIDLSSEFLQNWEINYLSGKPNSEILTTKICDTQLSWGQFSKTINTLIESEAGVKNKFLLSYIDSKTLEDPYLFANKILFFLWNYAFREKRDIIFNEHSYSGLVQKFTQTQNSERLKIFKIDF
ncbi:hypothetical protein [Mesomycoplasma flocculare]|uniref:hypothetical protein n=1 Tax=Mesomycoplasma flocculare TaxID=2128 RepID=UPI00136FBD0C|nr:hypothetical protein [Mesomycoplasma flocculare]MXR23049.1 hypothetical protein [Mesomycoplasma flocculare]